MTALQDRVALVTGQAIAVEGGYLKGLV